MSLDDSQRWTGRFYNRDYPNGMAVRVHLTERGVVIGETSDSDQLVWPFGALQAEPLLTSTSKAATITYHYMPDVRLEVSSPAFIARLTQWAPQVAASHRTWSYLKMAAWGAVAAVMVWLVVAAVNSQPARWVAGLVPTETRQSLGRTVLGSMAGRYRACTGRAGREVLRGLKVRLIGNQGAGVQYNVTVVDWSLVNAFAAPGGQILLTNGLIQAARSAEEVAGVLAHEIGHSIELHPEAGIVRAVGLSAAIDLLTGGGGTLAGAGNWLLRNSYARQDERSADQQALSLLRQAGISQTGLVAFFDRIGRGSDQSNNTIGGLFRTHPYPQERAARVRRSERYPTQPAMSDTDWRSLRRICDETQSLEESLKSKPE